MLLCVQQKQIIDVFLLPTRTGNVCTVQVVGKNTLAKVPSIIAKFLGKDNVNAYTGHCLRRTSATLLVDAGGDILSLKRHGGWKSTSVAEGYVNDSIEYKRRATSSIIRGEELIKTNDAEAAGPSERYSVVSTSTTTNNILKDMQSAVGSEFLSNNAVTIQNANNCSFTINVYK